MAIKSTRTPARRKTKSVTKPTVIYPLSNYEIRHRTHANATREIMAYYKSLTPEEKEVVGHVCPFGDPIAGMNEIKRLLGESIAKCKVIPFPVGGKRGVHVVKEA